MRIFMLLAVTSFLLLRGCLKRTLVWLKKKSRIPEDRDDE